MHSKMEARNPQQVPYSNVGPRSTLGLQTSAQAQAPRGQMVTQNRKCLGAFKGLGLQGLADPTMGLGNMKSHAEYAISNPTFFGLGPRLEAVHRVT